MKKLGAILLGLAGAIGLHSTPVLAETLPIEAVYPAGNDRLAMLNSIKMGRFRGRDGASLGLELEQQLRRVYIRGGSYYEIFVGNRGPRTDATVTGSADSSVESRSEIGRERICAERNAKGKCTKHRNVDVRCTRRSVTLTYTISVVGLRGARLYSASDSLVGSHLICPKSRQVPPADVVVSNLISKTASSLRYQFAPSQVRTDIRVKEGTSGLKGQAKKTFKKAVKMTKRNVGSACAMWKDVDYLVPDHGPTLFNLGLCAENERDYNLAEDLYRRSLKYNRSERYAIEAIDRLEKRRRAEQQLDMHSSRRKG